MTSHAKTAIGKAVEYVNPGQTVVIACDQPLFALAKTVEWAQKDRTWEDKLEVMLGGLHIEQAALKAFGTSLAGSGWVEVLSQATQATAGRERNHLSTVHVLRALDRGNKVSHPEEWDWTFSEKAWRPIWCTITDAAMSCQELILCGCKTSCT
ncbi:hypothetical protein ACROYT_G037482 [Oculina patagonica]